MALRHDLPARKLRAGEVGTLVELLGNDAYEVEFCDASGQTYAQFALRKDRVIPLHNRGKALTMALAEA